MVENVVVDGLKIQVLEIVMRAAEKKLEPVDKVIEMLLSAKNLNEKEKREIRKLEDGITNVLAVSCQVTYDAAFEIAERRRLIECEFERIENVC
jgi:hypothetical protein